MRAWAWLTWLESPLVTRKRHERNARNAFKLGVDAGAFGLVRPSRAPDVHHLRELPTDVVGVEIPPRCGADASPLPLAPLSERGVFQQTARADRMVVELARDGAWSPNASGHNDFLAWVERARVGQDAEGIRLSAG